MTGVQTCALPIFDTLNEIKIALPGTHTDAGNELIVKEYLAYKMFEKVSDVHFRARLVLLTLIDTNEKGVGKKKLYAIFVEDEEEVAQRLHGTPEGEFGIKMDRFEPEQAALVIMFQYLIGNTDFAVLSGPRKDACCHNARVLAGGDPLLRVAVPYDFDSAGLVDAVYAAPHEDLPIRKVSERLFRGFCAHNDTLAAARKEFLAQREAIQALVAQEPRLDAQRRRAAVRFVEAFYATLASDWSFERDLSGKCRR